MKKIMGIDIGEKRVGIALSDPLGLTAQPHDLIEYSCEEKLIQKLIEITQAYGVTKIIAGVPYGLRGEEGESAKKVLAFIRKLDKNTDIEIQTADERYSTAASRRIMLEGRASRKTRKHNIDKLAAAVILQGYLDKPEEK